MTVEIVLINLDRSPDRLAFMSAQLEKLGLRFTRLKATDGTSVSDEEFARLGSVWQRPISRTELACLLSHARAWQIAVDLDRPVLILEDDACLSTRLPDFLEEIEALADWGTVNIETRGTAKFVSRERAGFCPKSNVALHILEYDRGGAAAYLVRPAAARDLLARLEREAAPADAYLNKPSKIVRLQSDPGLAAPSFHADGELAEGAFRAAFKSTIAGRARGYGDDVRLLLTRPQFKLRRLRAHIASRVRKIIRLGSSTTRPIAICPTVLEAASGRAGQ